MSAPGTDSEEKIIKLIKENKLLYDKGDVFYKDISKRNNTWRFIAKEMGLKRIECEVLWNKIRDQYTAYLRKKNDPAGSRKQVFFRHTDLMSFYEPHYTPYKYKALSKINMGRLKGEIFEDSSNEISSPGGPDSDHEDLQVRNRFRDSISNVAATENTSHSNISTSQKRKFDQVDDCISEVKSEKSSTNQEIDEFEMFCSSLVPKLRRIYKKSPKIAAIAQLKIQELLIQLEYE